jgi:hypothetical protein
MVTTKPKLHRGFGASRRSAVKANAYSPIAQRRAK